MTLLCRIRALFALPERTSWGTLWLQAAARAQAAGDAAFTPEMLAVQAAYREPAPVPGVVFYQLPDEEEG